MHEKGLDRICVSFPPKRIAAASGGFEPVAKIRDIHTLVIDGVAESYRHAEMDQNATIAIFKRPIFWVVSFAFGCLLTSAAKVTGYDPEKISDAVVEWATGVAAEKKRKAAARARARADQDQCEAFNREAISEAQTDYRKADGEWNDCTARYRPSSNDPEFLCQTEMQVRITMKSRLDAAKGFVCVTGGVNK